METFNFKGVSLKKRKTKTRRKETEKIKRVRNNKIKNILYGEKYLEQSNTDLENNLTIQNRSNGLNAKYFFEL